MDGGRVVEELERAVARYRSLVEAAELDVWRADATGALASDLPEWRTFTGQPAGAVEGRGWLDAVHPDDRDRVQATWEATVAAGGPYHCEYRIVGPGGAVATILARARPVVVEGQVQEWIGTALDVTEARHAQEDYDRVLEAERAARKEAEVARDRLQVLATAGGRLASAQGDEQQVAAALLSAVVPELATFGVIHVLDDDGTTRALAARHARPEEEGDLWDVLLRFPPTLDQPDGAGAAMRTGRPQLVAAVDDATLAANLPDAEALAAVKEVGVRSIVSAPLVARGRVRGALSLVRESGPGFGEAELGLVEQLAWRGALGLENAQLLERQRRTAITLQRSLLSPVPPALLEACGVAYRPGADGLEVGGDWYDVVLRPSGRVALVVGDVQGRGLEAAAVMGQVRATIHAAAIEGFSPSQLLDIAGRVLEADGREELVTCIAATHHPGRGTLRVSRAGHLPAVLALPGEPARLLDDRGSAPLGVVTGSPMAEVEVAVPPGTLVVLVTDGVVERRDQALDEGLADLVAVVEGLRALEPQEVADALMALAEGHDDDRAALVFRT